MQAAQSPVSKTRFVTPDKKSIIHSINTLWQEQEFELIFSKESLTKKAAEIGKNDLCETSQKGTP